MTASTSLLPANIVALHSNRTEDLAATLAAWIEKHPLGVLEEEVILVQSNGMAEWLKMSLANTLGVSAALRLELPSRFAWRMYRQILGHQHVPYETPLDKTDMLWQLMHVLPRIIEGEADATYSAPLWEPLRNMGAMAPPSSSPQVPPHAADTAYTHYQLALRIADLMDQYQVYRPDWLQQWQAGHAQLIGARGDAVPVPEASLWQAALWPALLATKSEQAQQAIRPVLHQRSLAQLREGTPAQPLPRRIMVFGLSHLPVAILELLTHMARHSQVLLAVPNPCQHYWSDALDGRELFARMRRHSELGASRKRRQSALQVISSPSNIQSEWRADLAGTPMHAMHAHANPLLAQWGKQVRDYIRLLEHYETEYALHSAQASIESVPLYAKAESDESPSLLRQVQNHIRDLIPLGEALVTPPIAASDQSICFQVTHSPVREIEALHDHLLNELLPVQGNTLQPRDIVVMVPDIHQYAPLIEAVFGQYSAQDSRYIPFDIADIGPQDASALVKAVQWLTHLPQHRASLSELGDLLAVPAIAQRLGLDEEGVAQLQAWMPGSGIRWGVDAQHRQALGVETMGNTNTAWFGLQRMLLAYASGQAYAGVQPYTEVGGLAAAYVGALAQLVGLLQKWQQLLNQAGSASEWAERWRQMLGDFFSASNEADTAALTMLESALQKWLQATLTAQYDKPLPLAVARHAWLTNLPSPGTEQRFHSGGITFCTLLPMRAIPFRIVCLLGMNDGVYPRQTPPNEMDLMRQSGMMRPGDRSRAQDDRQLMLEALLSARDQLFVSWVGKSVRDNTPQPPSVLVAQLRDYLAARWSETLVTERTKEHPLQPFDASYFTTSAVSQHPVLTSWAQEWRAASQVHGPMTDEIAPHTTANWFERSSDQESKSWSTAALARLWKNPVQAWFQQRLQTRFAELPSATQDHEPLQMDGLDRWQIHSELLQHLQPQVESQATLASLQQAAADYLLALERAGALPIGLVGQQLQQEWLQQWHFLLPAWLQTVQDWSGPSIAPTLLTWGDGAGHETPDNHLNPTIPALGLQDWGMPMRTPTGDRNVVPESEAAVATDVSHMPRLVLSVLPHKILQASKKKNDDGPTSVQVQSRHLVQIWLQHLLLCAHEAPEDASLQWRVLALDAQLDVERVPAEQAQQWLSEITQIAAVALIKPIPVTWNAAVSWCAQMDQEAEPNPERALAAAESSYNGGFMHTGDVQRNPYAARLWPQFSALLATGEFELYAEQWLRSLNAWLDDYVQVMPAPTDAPEQ